MPTTQLSAAVARLGRTVPRPEPRETDGRLLARFIRTADEPAFRELVHRFGPMVLGVCRRIAGNAHLAEDAFQVAFLVLARRAADVRPREAVRGWLYGVASRTAQKARTMSVRRRAHEVLVPAVPEGATEPTEGADPDALRILDEEIGALPDHLRSAVVLCELNGASRKDAAARLGIPEGTLASRLGKARKVLAERLRKRGVALSATGLAWGFERLTSAAVPAQLSSATTALGDRAVPVPAAVTQLSREVFKTMLLTKLKIVIPIGLLLAVAGWAVGFTGEPGARADQRPAPLPARPAPGAKLDDKKPQPAAKPVGPGTLLLARPSGLVTLAPDGKEGVELTAPKNTNTDFTGRLSPDGTRVAFLVTEDGPPRVEPPEAWPIKVVIHTFGTKEPLVVDAPARQVTLAWTADGTRVVLTKSSGTKWETGVENLLMDPKTGKTEPLALPEGARVLDCGRDGKTFLVVYWDVKKSRLGLASKGDTEVRALTELKGWTGQHIGRLSPDGKQILYTDADPEQKDANKWGKSAKPYLLDVATKKREALADFPDNAQCVGVTWAPDGKRVAYTWHQLHAEFLKKETIRFADAQIETEGFLVVADANGKNPKTVASAKLENAMNTIFGSIDWR